MQVTLHDVKSLFRDCPAFARQYYILPPEFNCNFVNNDERVYNCLVTLDSIVDGSFVRIDDPNHPQYNISRFYQDHTPEAAAFLIRLIELIYG